MRNYRPTPKWPSAENQAAFLFFRVRRQKQLSHSFATCIGQLTTGLIQSATEPLVPGGKMGFAMELILTPILREMLAARSK